MPDRGGAPNVIMAELFDHDRYAGAVTADGVGQTMSLLDRQIARPERRRHPFTHAHRPPMGFPHNIERDHVTSPFLARQ